MKKHLTGLVVAVLLVGITSISHAAIFTDTFDDPAYTNSHWQDGTPDVPQTWSFISLNGSDLGYHATVDTYTTADPAVKFHNTGEYYNAGLYLESLVRIDSHPQAYSTTNKAVVAFGSTTGGAMDAGIQLDYTADPAFNLSSHLYLRTGAGTGGETINAQLPVSIKFDTFYKLAVQVNTDQSVDAFLYDLNNILLGSINTPNVLASDTGDFVAIYGRYATTFDDFSFSGTTVVPIPGAIWLFGSGLIGLIGVARRKRHA